MHGADACGSSPAARHSITNQSSLPHHWYDGSGRTLLADCRCAGNPGSSSVSTQSIAHSTSFVGHQPHTPSASHTEIELFHDVAFRQSYASFARRRSAPSGSAFLPSASKTAA